LLALGGVVALGLAGVIGVRVWVDRYLRSEAFTAQVNAAAGQALQAECRIDGVTWQGSAAYASTFEADGREAAAFRHLRFSDLRAEVDTGAFWDRVWRVNTVRIAQMTADFSAGQRRPESAAVLEPVVPRASGPAWLQRWLPNRTVLGPVTVDQFDFVREAVADVPGVTGRGFSLEMKPEVKPFRLNLSGRAGEVRMAGSSRLLKVSRIRGTLRPEGASLDQLEGTLEEAMVMAEGSVGFQTPGDLRLKMRLSGASLERWLPEDWLKRCTGMASTTANLRGDWRQPDTVKIEGDFQMKDLLLQALPLLDVIAKKTQNAAFFRMQIKEATGQYERVAPETWQVRRIRADAPGLLRLKGQVNTGRGGSLEGNLLLGIVPGTLRYLAGAEQTVFLSAERFSASPGQGGALSPDDAGLLWTAFQLSGTLDQPVEDLSERLARAWFNATVDQVAGLSMEGAATAARTGIKAAEAVLETAPPVLQKAPEILHQGVDSGLKLLDGLLPR
jgi:hypothetical protein